MTKLLIGVLSLALLGTGVFVGVAGGLDSQPARSVSLPGSTTGDDTTTGTTTTGTTTAEAEDISGPCDEAEHRNDPRCTGAAPDDDRSGSDNSGSDGDGTGDEQDNLGGDDDGDDDVDDDDGDDDGDDDDGDDDEDRSGSNSGKS